MCMFLSLTYFIVYCQNELSSLQLFIYISLSVNLIDHSPQKHMSLWHLFLSILKITFFHVRLARGLKTQKLQDTEQLMFQDSLHEG